MTKSARKTNMGNSIPWCTTVKPEQMALFKGDCITPLTPAIGTKVAKNSFSNFTMNAVEDFFSKKYGIPYYLLEQILWEAEVFERTPGTTPATKHAIAPITEDVVWAVVNDYKRRNVEVQTGELV